MPKDNERMIKETHLTPYRYKRWKVVYDRDEYGTVFIDTDKGDKAADTN